jgi:hypothetical protein
MVVLHYILLWNRLKLFRWLTQVTTSTSSTRKRTAAGTFVSIEDQIKKWLEGKRI